MERMLVVTFDDETSASAGKSALHQLELEGTIAIYAGAVVVKQADGTATVRQYDDFGPVGTLLGTSIGSLIGLLGGPVGMAFGGTSGFVLGGLFDLGNVRVGEDFLDNVSKSLTTNKVAVVAEIDEDWTTPVDTRMEALGGKVFRRALSEVQADANGADIAAMKVDLAQLKQELAKEDADRRTKLQNRINELQAQLDAQEKKARERREAFARRQSSKKEVLKTKAAAAHRALKELANTPV